MVLRNLFRTQSKHSVCRVFSEVLFADEIYKNQLWHSKERAEILDVDLSSLAIGY